MILHALVLSLSIAAVSEGPALVLMHPQTLMELEGGLDVARVAFAGAQRVKDNAELAKNALYADVVTTLGRDVEELYAKDAKYGVGMKFTHRGFDIGWLTSPDTRWELAAVVNRVDRKVFHPGTCGEVRFIYRLAYTTKTKAGELFSSRLPATLNVVHFVDDDGAQCARAAVRPMDGNLVGTKPKAVEVNLQTVRWPSTVRPDMGGHAEYILRVFQRARGKTRDELVPGLLENTPDAERIAKDAALKRELATWVRDNIARIDAGTAVLPDKFLAKRAVSVTPHGMARPQNRPWLKALDVTSIDAASLASTTHVRTHAELTRRLDGLTCMGCHQARSLAGFHALGMERDATRIVDALGAGMSPHFHEDLPRREKYARDLVAGRVPDEVRRPPERQTDRGGFGDACGLDASSTPGSFRAWTCGAGFSCMKVDEDEVGQCMPSSANGELTGAVGGACRPGTVDMKRDKIAALGNDRCPSTAICEDVHVGFPGGMCAGTCASESSAVEPGATCGAIAVLTPFNECLARGGLFSTCAQHARPASLRECGFDNPCRPDYLCARTPSGTSACLPPYFVLQMRVDGHPLPKSKLSWRDLLP
jgi:hypothetical protein